MESTPCSSPSRTPACTVLVPCWNAASTIEWALGTVLAERDVSFECVVIDDGSTDGTADMVAAIAERDPRVVLLRLPLNGGVSNARNRGLEIARGEWIAFHDADDRIMPGGLTALMRPAQPPDVLAVVASASGPTGTDLAVAAVRHPRHPRAGSHSIASHPGLLYYASATGKAFHRSLLADLRFAGRVLGDQSWTVRALLRAGTHIEVVEETVFEYSPASCRNVDRDDHVAHAFLRHGRDGDGRRGAPCSSRSPRRWTR